jgi:hypothetical protein
MVFWVYFHLTLDDRERTIFSKGPLVIIIHNFSLIFNRFLKTCILGFFKNFSHSLYSTVKWVGMICLEKWVKFWQNHLFADITLLTKHCTTRNQKNYFNHVKKHASNYSEIKKLAMPFLISVLCLLYLTYWLPWGSPVGLLKIDFSTMTDTGGSQDYII